jgi:hypothetical protein
MQLQTERNSSLRVLGGRALVQTSVKVAANVAHIALTDPGKAFPRRWSGRRNHLKGGIGDLAIPNRRKGRIIQDLEDRRSKPLTYGGRPYPVLAIAFRSVATLMCGQLSPLKFNNTVWVYCSC